MSNLAFDVNLVPWQQEVWNCQKRFRVIAAGRRCGKSRLAALLLIFYALTCPTKTAKVVYVAPTQGQARDIMWDLIIELAGDLVQATHRNDLHIKLQNGVTIQLKGADRPETMRGLSLWFVVLDEYADIRADVWEKILLPALSDHDGAALFIGTPMGRNHFYDLYMAAELGDDEDFAAFHFTSYDNPYLGRDTIERAKKTMSRTAFSQEFMASFESSGGQLFQDDWLKMEDEAPSDGEYIITIDPAGFAQVSNQRRAKSRLDDTAICITKISGDNWYVQDIIYGRWTLEETAQKIFDAVLKWRPVRVGIERGIAQQALLSPLQARMRQYNRFINIELLTHGNQKKTDRIMWALQGRFEQGLITMAPGDWNTTFIDQLMQFPSRLTHDDLIDALAYVDQLALVGNNDDEYYDDDEAYTDEYTGY